MAQVAFDLGSQTLLQQFVTKHPEFVPVYEFAGEPDFVRSAKSAAELAQASVQAELFASLTAVIIHQQLSGKVAKVFESRLFDACKGRVEPQAIIEIGESGLRSLGLSTSKTRAVLGVAEEVFKKELSFESFGQMSDEEISARISKMFGFGPWSAHMFMLFSLGRLNVWAPADLGVRKGFAKLYALKEMPSIREMHGIGERYMPMASLATWYLWRVLEMPEMPLA